MTSSAILLLGVGLGLRHAIDADHVVVVSALVQRERGLLRAARIAALWGVGHTLAFLGIGLLIVLANVRVPPALERLAELLVATMLIGFGVSHLLSARRKEELPAQRSNALASARPVAIGLVHGLAGSAGIALLAATTIGSPSLAVTFLLLVAAGTVFGMVSLTLLLSRPIGWTMRREGRLKQAAVLVASLLSILLGTLVVARFVVVGE